MIRMFAVLMALGLLLSFCFPGLAHAQCNLPPGQVVSAKNMDCVVFNRKEARYIGVPKSLKLRALAGCVPKPGCGKTLLVYGIDRKGNVRCQGWGPINGPDFEACGCVW